jgi:hypothetical protein
MGGATHDKEGVMTGWDNLIADDRGRHLVIERAKHL